MDQRWLDHEMLEQRQRVHSMVAGLAYAAMSAGSTRSQIKAMILALRRSEVAVIGDEEAEGLIEGLGLGED